LSDVSEKVAYKTEGLQERFSIGAGQSIIARGHGGFDDLSNEFRGKPVEHVRWRTGGGGKGEL